MSAALENDFAEGVATFYEELVGGKVVDAFGSVLKLANVEARIADEKSAEDAAANAHGEMLLNCEVKLGQAIVQQIEELVRSRNAAAEEQKRRNEEAREAKAKAHRERQMRRKSEGYRTSNDMRAQLLEQSRRHKLKEQRKAEASQAQQDEALRKQMQREEEDLPRLQRAAELCRLAESLRVVTNKDGRTDGNAAAETCLEQYSQLVCAGLNERYELILDELKTHRSLAHQSTSFGAQVETSEDDPYLQALSYILLYADSLIEKLMLGEYAVASTETATELATAPIVKQVEARTSETVVFVLNAFHKDRRIDQWVRAVQTERQSLGDAQVAELDNLLNDMMEVQQYCGHFTRALLGLGVLDPAKLAAGGIAEKQVDLASAYIQLEEAWLSLSLSKARAIADLSGEGQECVNSLVKDTFYIVSKGFARAVHTENSQSCSAMVNHIYRLLEDDYSKAIKAILRGAEAHAGGRADAGSGSGASGHRGGARSERSDGRRNEDHYDAAGSEVDLFAAALEGDIQGTSRLDSALLIAINTIELSSIFMNDLVGQIEAEIEARFPDQLALVDMALHDLRATAEEHKTLRTQALDEVVATCFRPMFLSAADAGVTKMTYKVNNAIYETYEREDPFVSKFIDAQIEQSRIFRKCRAHLSKQNFGTLLGLVAREVAYAWETALLKHQSFNDLGALRLADEIRAMMAMLSSLYLTREEREQAEVRPDLLEHLAEDQESIQMDIRKHFARLLQISFLLSLELTSHVQMLPCPFTPVLSDADVRRVLARRAPPEPGVSIAQLDVSQHVPQDESVSAKPRTPPRAPPHV
ncbi:Conserved oligomeric Golgi complex subunit 4 [Hondaea fermentalgiana]|uniref:Conserved oligomeric Golgi complex subunit 4 n=1 Tax=Hondaea fermentalgiana TaxID=2315210 RepID=A0A2R5GK12_9STRA|nr:Conserved oligomeric Golgi complex subunit 4 [Hondaea fermentalgiana]|eukprot:GBG31242.1 Conserved oligomeric Golgi complex subunit 4 [Hondaea fermentalgiana]